MFDLLYNRISWKTQHRMGTALSELTIPTEEVAGRNATWLMLLTSCCCGKERNVGDFPVLLKNDPSLTCVLEV